MITIKKCSQADKEHKNSTRQYAHTYHHKNVICLAGAWKDLSVDHQMGILAHEVGHLLVGKVEHSELEADKTANKFFDIHIRYKDSKYGNRLQYLNLNDSMNVWEWLNDNVRVEGK